MHWGVTACWEEMNRFSGKWVIKSWSRKSKRLTAFIWLYGIRRYCWTGGESWPRNSKIWFSLFNPIQSFVNHRKWIWGVPILILTILFGFTERYTGKIAFNIKITLPKTIKFTHETEYDRFRTGQENIPQLTGKKIWPASEFPAHANKGAVRVQETLWSIYANRNL